jgi:hypothetical protein
LVRMRSPVRVRAWAPNFTDSFQTPIRIMLTGGDLLAGFVFALLVLLDMGNTCVTQRTNAPIVTIRINPKT